MIQPNTICRIQKCKPCRTPRVAECALAGSTSRAASGSASESGRTYGVPALSVPTETSTPRSSMVSNCFSDGKERILHQWNPMVKSVRVLPRGGHVDAPRARQGDPSQQRKSRTRGSEGVLRGCWSSCEPKERMKALQLLRHRREARHKRARAGRSPACARPLR